MMPDYILEQTGHIGLLHFSGNLTENCIEKLRQGFMASFERSDYVIVNLTQVTALDRGCFRLFCAAYRKFIGSNKKLFLVSHGPKVFSAIDAAGRSERASGCNTECRDSCLWNRYI